MQTHWSQLGSGGLPAATFSGDFQVIQWRQEATTTHLKTGSQNAPGFCPSAIVISARRVFSLTD